MLACSLALSAEKQVVKETGLCHYTAIRGD